MARCLSSIRYRNEVAVFEVADSGIGIKKEDIQSIFEPFKRLAYTRVYADGTGLGLTITNLLATIMGGELECIANTVAATGLF